MNDLENRGVNVQVEDVSLLKAQLSTLIKKKKQLHSLNELAGYFQACEKVSKAILYEQIKRENIFDAVMQYNECMEKSKQNTSEENTPDNPSSEKSTKQE